MTLRTLAEHPSLIIAMEEPVLFVVWTGIAPRVEDVRASTTTLLEQARTLGRCGLIVSIHPTMPLPDERARTAIREEVGKLDPYLVCSATVVAREGFAGAAVRAVISTLQILARPSHAVKTCSTIVDAEVFVRNELTKSGARPPPDFVIERGFERLTTKG